MENLQARIKELGGNLPCEKDWCRTMYEIFQFYDDNPEIRESFDDFVKRGICACDSANLEERKAVFDDYGPTPKECTNSGCFLPFILKAFGNGKESSEFLIAQRAKVDDFKYERGIQDEQAAWQVWTAKEENGMSYAKKFRAEYLNKHPNSTLVPD